MKLPATITTGLWCCWGYSPPLKDGDKLRKLAKRIDAATGHVQKNLKSNDPDGWLPFADAARLLPVARTVTEPDAQGGTRATWVPAGLGRLVGTGDELCFIDIDDCLDDHGRITSKLARRFVNLAKTYTEVSPSGHGLRLVAKGVRPAFLGTSERGRAGDTDFEIYDGASTRWVSITGNRFKAKRWPVRPLPAKAVALLASNWRSSPRPTAGRADSPDATVAATASELDQLAAGGPLIPGVAVDWTRAPSASEGFAQATLGALNAVWRTSGREAHLGSVLATACDAVGSDRKDKGERGILKILDTGEIERARVPWTFYDVLRAVRFFREQRDDRDFVSRAIQQAPLDLLGPVIHRLIQTHSGAHWHIAYHAMRRGIAPRLLVPLGVKRSTIDMVQRFISTKRKTA